MNDLDLILNEIKKKSASREITNKINLKLISDIESEIIWINSYLTRKSISSKDYKPNTADEDQPKRLRLYYLYEAKSALIDFLKKK